MAVPTARCSALWVDLALCPVFCSNEGMVIVRVWLGDWEQAAPYVFIDVARGQHPHTHPSISEPLLTACILN